MPPKRLRILYRKSMGGRAPRPYHRCPTPPLIEESSDSDLQSSSDKEDLGDDHEIQGGRAAKLVMPLVDDLVKSVQMPELRTLQTSNEDGSGDPIVTVSYEHIATNGLDKVMKSLKNDDDIAQKKIILKLQSYLIGKKKGRDKIKSAFSLIPGLEKKEAEDKEEALEKKSVPLRCFFLKIDKNLLVRLTRTLKNASISATLKVKGSGNNTPGTSASTSTDGNGVRPHPYKRAASKANLTKAVFGTGETEITVSSLLRSSTPGVLKLTAQSEIKNNLQWATTGADLQLIIHIECAKTAPRITKRLNLNADHTLLAMYKLDDATKEVTIVAEDEVEIKCHGVILMANSAVFRSMLAPQQDTAEAPTRIELKEYSALGVDEFVRFLYGLSIPFENIKFYVALELFKLGNKFQVKKLKNSLKHLLCEKPLDISGSGFYSVNSLLKVYLAVKNDEGLEELRAHAISEFAKYELNKDELDRWFGHLGSEDKAELLYELSEWIK